MKEEFDKDIMDYVDGISEEITEREVLQEAIELKQLLSELKEMPQEQVAAEVDERVQQFIQQKNETEKPIRKPNRWLPYMAVAASVILLLFVYLEGSSFESEYAQLATNPDKLSFIYELNEESLQPKDIQWLRSELTNESHPNIKVTIIDLLNNYEAQLDTEYFKNLQQESVPTVQMALLDALEGARDPDLSQELTAFAQRTDLDQTVRSKAMKILSNQSK